MYDVCVRTGHGGTDARGVYRNPGILPDIFAGLHLEPELAFVLDDGGEVAGYILDTADTPGYADTFRRTWLPGLTALVPGIGRYEQQLREYGFAGVAESRAAEADTGTRRNRLLFWLLNRFGPGPAPRSAG